MPHGDISVTLVPLHERCDSPRKYKKDALISSSNRNSGRTLVLKVPRDLKDAATERRGSATKPLATLAK